MSKHIKQSMVQAKLEKRAKYENFKRRQRRKARKAMVAGMGQMYLAGRKSA